MWYTPVVASPIIKARIDPGTLAALERWELREDHRRTRTAWAGISALVRLALRRLVGVDGPDGLSAYQDCDGWRWILRARGEIVAEGWRPFETERGALDAARRVFSREL